MHIAMQASLTDLLSVSWITRHCRTAYRFCGWVDGEGATSHSASFRVTGSLEPAQIVTALSAENRMVSLMGLIRPPFFFYLALS